MRRRALAIGLVGLWLAAAASAAAASMPRLVSPAKIGAVGLGLSAASYRQALGEEPTRFTVPGNRVRLIFAKSELSVTLDAHGRGAVIETAAREYRTRAGAHPCGSAKVLAREFGRKLVELREPTTGTVVGYRAGNLTFSVTMDQIGSVILSSRPVSPAFAANTPHCGTGEEGE